MSSFLARGCEAQQQPLGVVLFCERTGMQFLFEGIVWDVVVVVVGVVDC